MVAFIVSNCSGLSSLILNTELITWFSFFDHVKSVPDQFSRARFLLCSSMDWSWRLSFWASSSCFSSLSSAIFRSMSRNFVSISFSWDFTEFDALQDILNAAQIHCKQKSGNTIFHLKKIKIKTQMNEINHLVSFLFIYIFWFALINLSKDVELDTIDCSKSQTVWRRKACKQNWNLISSTFRFILVLFHPVY